MQKKYEVIGIVGEGAYGIVYKCKNKETNEYVAIKKFKETDDEIVLKTMKREIEMLKKIRHENIVEFKEVFIHKKNIYLVFEYVDKNLLELLQETPNGISPSKIKYLIYQLIKAIKYLHSKNIIHRDIKPENLLINQDLKLKLCDFGFARDIKLNSEMNNISQMTDYVATRWYRAPELLLTGGIYGPEVDYWAIGCIMGELIDGNPIFPGDDEYDQLNYIIKIIGNLPEKFIQLFYENPIFEDKELLVVDKIESLDKRYFGKFSKDGIDFMKKLLRIDPLKRLNGDNVFKHKYYDDYLDNKSNSTIIHKVELEIVNRNNLLLRNGKENFYMSDNLSEKKKKKSRDKKFNNNNIKFKTFNKLEEEKGVNTTLYTQSQRNNFLPFNNLNTINNLNTNTNLNKMNNLNTNNNLNSMKTLNTMNNLISMNYLNTNNNLNLMNNLSNNLTYSYNLSQSFSPEKNNNNLNKNSIINIKNLDEGKQKFQNKTQNDYNKLNKLDNQIDKHFALATSHLAGYQTYINQKNDKYNFSINTNFNDKLNMTNNKKNDYSNKEISRNKSNEKDNQMHKITMFYLGNFGNNNKNKKIKIKNKNQLSIIETLNIENKFSYVPHNGKTKFTLKFPKIYQLYSNLSGNNLTPTNNFQIQKINKYYN